MANEVVDLSELCRLCLDSPSLLVSFDTPVQFTTKTIPELIKYCVDVESNANDGGISPKNICQACLEKLQVVFEFKWKSHESDKYIKQIISHSGDIAEEPDITPYSPAPLNDSSYFGQDEDEDSLLQPMDYDYHQENQNHHQIQIQKPRQRLHALQYRQQQHKISKNSIIVNGIELKKGQRHGMFVCHICRKSFKYVKPYKNHLKIHKSTHKPLSYYKRKKLAQLGGIAPAKISEFTRRPTTASSSSAAAAFTTPKKQPVFKKEPQAQYDSVSPYNSPAPYEEDAALHTIAAHAARDSSPDFGEFMLNSSRQLLNGGEVDDEEELLVERSVGRPRSSKKHNDDDMDYHPNRRIKPKSASLKKTPAPEVSLTEKRIRLRTAIESNNATLVRKPGPLSKTRGKRIDNNVQIEGFSEVDISKMLKSKKDEMIDMGEDTTSQQSHSNRSRSRSSSVELIPEIDIFDRS